MYCSYSVQKVYDNFQNLLYITNKTCQNLGYNNILNVEMHKRVIVGVVALQVWKIHMC